MYRAMSLLLLLVLGLVCWNLPRAGPPPEDAADPPGPPAIEAACAETAQWLSRQLGSDDQTIVRPPFVLGGDVGGAALDRIYRDPIAPTAAAIATQYSVTPLNKPLVIVLFADEASHRRWAQTLFGDRDVSSFGYYRPHLRTIVWNAGRGTAAIGHELTHALMADDFPDAPAWLQEGLASLHEAARLRADGSGLEGEVNWRWEQLAEAIRANRLRPLRSLLEDRAFYGPDERLNYAHARYFCLFLQRRGLLEECYRRLRANVQTDPRGTATVADLFPQSSWGQLDAEFRRWAQQLGNDSRGPSR